MKMEIRKYLSKIGTRGGKVKSDAKAAASKANGKKGGRPRTSRLTTGNMMKK